MPQFSPRKYPFKTYTEEEADTCVLICIQRKHAHALAGVLQILEDRTAWATIDDWEKGRQFVFLLQEEIMTSCADTIAAKLAALLSKKGMSIGNTTEIAKAAQLLAKAARKSAAQSATVLSQIKPLLEDDEDEQKVEPTPVVKPGSGAKW